MARPAAAVPLGGLAGGGREDDLHVIAEHGYEGAASAGQDQRAQAVNLFITDMLARVSNRPRVTALRRLPRRFSNGVTTAVTPFQSSEK